MGMYSTFLEQDIEIKDLEGLKKALKGVDCYNLFDGEELDFCEWGGHKIEGYWYKETREVLNLIAPFVEGIVLFSYEEGWNFRIIFKEGKVYTQKPKEPEYHEPQLLEVE